MEDQSKQLNASKVVIRLVVLTVILIVINFGLKEYSCEITSRISALAGVVYGAIAYLLIKC
jgi:hypothetical protein